MKTIKKPIVNEAEINHLKNLFSAKKWCAEFQRIKSQLSGQLSKLKT